VVGPEARPPGDLGEVPAAGQPGLAQRPADLARRVAGRLGGRGRSGARHGLPPPERNSVRPGRVAWVSPRRAGGGGCDGTFADGSARPGRRAGLGRRLGRLRDLGPGPRQGRRRRQGDVLGGILGGVLGGGGSGGGGILGRQVSYRCDDDRRFTASFQPLGGGVSVDTDRRTYRLHARDGDGGRDRREYRSEDGDVRLEVDGDRAELRVEGGDDYEGCEAR
jgi:hypothetical protein